MEITITADTTKVTKKLSGMAKGLSDFSKPLDLVGGDLLNFFGNEVFETQGAALGEVWKALAASTLVLRAARSGYYKNTPIVTDKILIWTGNLKGGFKKEVKPLQLRIYNDDEKFKYHQKTQRRMLGVNAKVVTIVIDRINQYAEQIIAQ